MDVTNYIKKNVQRGGVKMLRKLKHIFSSSWKLAINLKYNKQRNKHNVVLEKNICIEWALQYV